jgi:hypothetical protein
MKHYTPLSAHLGFDFFEFPFGHAVDLMRMALREARRAGAPVGCPFA